MHSTLLVIAVVASVCGLLPGHLLAQGIWSAPVIPGEIVVKYRHGAPALHGGAAGTADRVYQETTPGQSGAASVALRHGLRGVEPLHQLRAAGTKPQAAGVSTLHRLVFPSRADTAAIIAELKSLPEVEYAEPNFAGSLCYAPGDTLWSEQSGDLALIGMESGWQSQLAATGFVGGGSTVTVAVIDSGIDVSHAELAAAVDLSRSYDFVENAATTSTDDLGHGTRVAGIVGAAANNGQGIAGIAFGCRLMSLDVSTSTGAVSSARVASAVAYAASNGAHVINMSLRFTGFSQALKDACDAAELGGAVLVAASGNEYRGDRSVYPASFNSVIGVASIDDDGSRSLWSNYNGLATDVADIAAPGLTVFSTYLRGEYNGTLGSGTSFAAPMVTGVAALLRTMYPAQSNGAIRTHIMNTAQPAPFRTQFEPDGWAGAGVLSAQNALGTPMQPAFRIAQIVIDDNPGLDPANNGDGNLDPNEKVLVLPTLINDAADAATISATVSTTNTAVTVVDGGGLWPVIPNGGQAAPADPFMIKLEQSAQAQIAEFTFSITANGGTYAASFPMRVQTENPLNLDTATHMIPIVWNAGTTYQLTGPQTFLQGLQIEPGTIVRMSPTSSITISGGPLDVQGTAGRPVRITSLGPVRGGAVNIAAVAGEATLRHVVVENCAGILNQAPVTTIEYCTARNNEGVGIANPAGIHPLVGCTAENNTMGGINSAAMVRQCTAAGNGGYGIQAAAAEQCTAEGNTGTGISAAMATGCSATANTGNGIVVSAGANNCTARGNTGGGISCSGGPTNGCVAYRNDGTGLVNTSAGEVQGCIVLQNRTGGIVANAPAVENCWVDGNQGGPAIRSTNGTAVSGSTVSENQGAPFLGIESVAGSKVFGNQSGISGATAVTGSYVSENRSAGILAGAVDSCAVIGNLLEGLKNPGAVTNSAIAFNTGIGVDAPASLSACTVANNSGYGVKNLAGSGAMNNCNLLGNGPYDYYDDENDAPTGSSSKDCRFNYWGPLTTAEITSSPTQIDATRIYDKYDSGLASGWYANYGAIGAQYSVSPVAAPSAASPTYLSRVLPDLSELVGVGQTTFTLAFSANMDTTTEPQVSFGPNTPFTDHFVTAWPGWIDARTWQGQFHIQSDTVDGIQTIRVHGAVDAGGFAIPDDTVHEFEIAGSLSANNGLAIGSGPTIINVSWTDDDKPAGTIGFNVHRSLTGEAGSYSQLNGAPLTGTQYTDTGLAASTTYFYIVDLIDSGNNAYQWTAPFFGTTTGSSAVSNWQQY